MREKMEQKRRVIDWLEYVWFVGCKTNKRIEESNLTGFVCCQAESFNQMEKAEKDRLSTFSIVVPWSEQDICQRFNSFQAAVHECGHMFRNIGQDALDQPP